jgi:hypothetical protein
MFKILLGYCFNLRTQFLLFGGCKQKMLAANHKVVLSLTTQTKFFTSWRTTSNF